MDLYLFEIFGVFVRILEIFRILLKYPQNTETWIWGEQCICTRLSLSPSNVVAGVLEIHGFVSFRDFSRFWKIFGNIQNFAQVSSKFRKMALGRTMHFFQIVFESFKRTSWGT